jgi:mitochondrial fission protein ELM1
MNHKRIWIINEGSQGHLVQSRGLARELKKRLPAEVHELTARLMPRSSFIRSVTKRILRRWSVAWLFKTTHAVSGIPLLPPDLIISSGPRSLTALQYFARAYDCPSVFVQATINVSRNAVSVIMRPDDGVRRDDTIFIPLLFNEITRSAIFEAKLEYLKSFAGDLDAGLRVMFIGASSAKIVFEDEDWDGLAGWINRSFEEDGMRWLVTTSYRTGGALEARLREAINPAALFDAVWYATGPRKVTKAFLGMADSVYVTMDSMTMISEAVSSGLPVRVIRPRKVAAGGSNPDMRYVKALATQGLITLVDSSEEGWTTPATGRIRDVDYGPSIEKLLVKIGWNEPTGDAGRTGGAL